MNGVLRLSALARVLTSCALARVLKPCALAVLLMPCAVSAETVTGPARLIDGDTMEIRGRVVRLHGIDAPETGQTCRDGTGRIYRCGEDAEKALRHLTDGSRVTCSGDEEDQYGRLIAVCRAGDTDLSREMVRKGWAVAFRRFSDDYLEEELDAAKAVRGIWRGGFTRPVEHRAYLWEEAASARPDRCPIKGNISVRTGERIYHAPWSRWYSRTRINEAKGERWFCSEAEAVEAGWRAPFR